MKCNVATISAIAWAAFFSGLAPGEGRGVDLPARLAPITKSASPFVGVTYLQIVEPCCDGRTGILPRPVAVHVVEIDPSAPGVRFFGSPGNGDAPHEFTRRTTSEFVESSGTAIAVNGDFYGTETGANSDVSGLAVSNGEVASAAATDGTCPHSLVIFKDGRAAIVSDGSTPAGAWNAVSGNQRILEGGKIVAPDDKYTRTLNPHTAAGIDADSGHVFLLVVDGRQDKFSEGLRTDEIAAILAEFGVDDAINLDG